MATGVIYKVNCGDDCGPKKRCVKKYDAYCVIYKGEDRPDLGINSGDNLEEIIEKLELIINNILTQITELQIYITEEINNIYEQIDIINGILEDLSDRLDDLEETFCERVAECTVIQDLLDDLYDLESNFCDRVMECKDPIWEIMESRSGCSSSSSSFTAWSSSSSKNGYYVETYEDVNPMSDTFGQTRVERRTDLDGTCIAYGSDWAVLQRDCSTSSSTYTPAPGSPNAIYGWQRIKDMNPNSPTSGEEKWTRDTGYDRTCNPPSLPAQNANGCRKCAQVQILSTEGQTTDFQNVQFDNLASPFSYVPGAGICITGPLWDESNISTTVTGSANVVITDPNELGWEVLVNRSTVYTGSGDFSGPISFDITISYSAETFKEGTYYICN